MRDPFFATLALPLASVPSRGPDWSRGAYLADVPHYRLEDRVRFYANTDPLAALLRTDLRSHVAIDLVDEYVRAVAVEVVPTPDDWSAVAGYLVVHLEATTDAPEIAALTQLGRLARPATEDSERLLGSLAQRTAVDTDRWPLAPIARAPSLCLSGTPDDDSVGLVRWPGSTPTQRRLVDLVTMPAYGRQVPTPFELDVNRPTPSYLVAASGSSVAAVRVRTVRDDHVAEMRTHWLDALLVELTQHDTAIALVERARDMVPESSGGDWRKFEQRFRRWRTVSAWQASTDHPLEAALASFVRAEIRTDSLVSRVEAELADHARAAVLRADENLNRIALLLSAIAIVLTIVQIVR
ncbi:hypothetical protein [Solicola gregarius]|uniref:Uncharacterized protein n=1 Tax=Solicola gregarius TaxID=2908642 RepID=A0AA46TGH5_9ACTN|nr:hypothetical protein [Solicola gregarius]UYM04715.1 hypothetical protein L0C25_19585 [Solicola gregarius]